MRKRKTDAGKAGEKVVDYRHRTSKRLNIPPAGLEARGEIAREKRIRWAYNPHLAPALRFDGTGKSDDIAELIDAAGKRQLEPEEFKRLQEAFRNHEPWLEWAGKREQQWCVADPVALHIHERISTQAILKVARREDIQRDLFADPEHEYREAVQFYKHPMDWTNRMILGDSLSVMASLARREALAGKVQMIYMDPPYGIKYASNFQPEVGRRDVKDRDEDLTREPEMVKAYRDTWTLGVHSYLSYLRDRLLLCKELLADTGSIFVQISDENLHRVRAVMDEVFQPDSFVSVITVKKTGGMGQELIDNVSDFILWYAKDRQKIKYIPLFNEKVIGEGSGERYSRVELPSGEIRPLREEEIYNPSLIPVNSRVFLGGPLTSQTPSESTTFEFQLEGHNLRPSKGGWKTNIVGMSRLINSERLLSTREFVNYKMCIDDFPATSVGNLWSDTMGTAEQDKKYVVQTTTKVIQRCLLMTTDPGDLVLDPTCGSGTTAYVAEQWGRRWITLDVSRVALAIARQRLLTAKFDYYRLRPTNAGDVQRNPDGSWLTDPEGQIPGSCTFDCKTVPHVTLKSIAQNQALDPIFDKWSPVLAEKLANLNSALGQGVTKALRQKLLGKLELKQKREGKRAVTDADERRWQLPEKEWKEWEVPFDADPDWPQALQEALKDYRGAWRQKMDEVNACIAARADQEELVDQPFLERNRVRVAGPFTMEGVIPAEESIDAGDPEASPIGGAPEDLETFDEGGGALRSEAQNTEAYLDRMTRLLRGDGVRFPDNKVMKFTTLEALADGSTIHAKGIWGEGTEERQVAVIFGPQYGPLTTRIVEEGIRIAARRGFDDVVFAAFSFDAQAQVTIQEVTDPAIKLHMAQIRPDVNMGDLLKTTVSSQLFTVSGSPRTRLERGEDGQYIVHMEGVDIYDPVTNAVRSSGAEKVAAWFLDSDYDGRCFCVCQAFFPDRNAWEKLGKALGGALDEEAFAKLSGTVSLPFTAGKHSRIAVKVIDPRGNEVLRVHRLGEYDTKR
jgi:adenine-specific DNA-methyltransferase